MSWKVIAIIVLTIVYVVQLACVAKELNEGEYTRRYKVLIDLIPFMFLVFFMWNVIQFLYEVCIEDTLDSFKKIRW